MPTAIPVRVYRPRLLLLIVFGAVAIATAGRALAEPGSEIVSIPLPNGNPRDRLNREDATGEDLAAARKVIAEKVGPMDRAVGLGGARVWKSGGQRALDVTVEFPEPLASQGPWTTQICNGKYLTIFEYAVEQGRIFHLVVDLKDNNALEWGPSDETWNLDKIRNVVLIDSQTNGQLGSWATGADFLREPPCPEITAGK